MRAATPPPNRPPSRRPPLAAWALCLLAQCLWALGASPAWSQGSEAGNGPDSARPSPRAWDATVGWVVSHGPPYPGSALRDTRLTPGLALRWGRVSLASRSAFSVRGAEAGTGGGLRVELADGERLRVGLGLRADSGRQESDSEELRGLGDVRRTVRLRLSASYRLDDGWRLRSVAAVDALGRGGGLQGDLQVLRDLPLSPSLSLNGTASLGWGNRRYLQAYYGVTPEQAARSGYPVTTPSAGLRDLSFSLGLRRELGPRWALFGGAGVSRLIGQAADSPLTREPGSWSLSLGMVYRL